MQWSDMWIFKADITGCFNQLYWDQHTTPLMGFMLDDNTLMLMLMLTCGFGVGVTPMIWSEVGDAMNRTANLTTHARHRKRAVRDGNVARSTSGCHPRPRLRVNPD